MGKLVLKGIFLFAALTVSFARTEEECRQEAMKCQKFSLTEIDPADTDEDICNFIIDGFNCSQNLLCATDVTTRILFITAKNYLRSRNVPCNRIDQEFYTTKADACEECVIKYVDKLYAVNANPPKTNSEAIMILCQHLSEYIVCQLEDGTCKPEDNCISSKSSCHPTINELRKIRDEEVTRLRIETCQVDALNFGIRQACSFSLIVSMILAMVILQ